jgi:hypothetical protein
MACVSTVGNMYGARYAVWRGVPSCVAADVWRDLPSKPEPGELPTLPYDPHKTSLNEPDESHDAPDRFRSPSSCSTCMRTRERTLLPHEATYAKNRNTRTYE